MVSEKITRPSPVIAIMGATATGKTDLAMRLAERFDGEIVSMDSRQVYRGLDIGTAKPTREQRTRVPHHLIDILDAQEAHSAGQHLRVTRAAVDGIRSRGRLPLLAGGTGLYFKVFFEGLIDPGIPEDVLAELRRGMSKRSTSELYGELARCDPERASGISPNDRVRITRALEICWATGVPYSQHVREQERSSEQAPRWPRIVLSCRREKLRKRIATRTASMYRAGWVAEVAALLRGGCPVDAPAMNSLGYRVIADALQGGVDPEDTLPRVVTMTQQYAKRQETFFRGVPHTQVIDVENPGMEAAVDALVTAALSV